MPRWLSFLYGISAVAGSIVGLVSMIPLLLQGGHFGFPGELLLLLSLSFYAFGIWSGIKAIRRRDGWSRSARWFWLAQVPMFSSSTFSFLISCAAGLWVYGRYSSQGLGAGASAYLGSGLRWSYGQGTPEVVVGINILALLAALFLFKRSPQ